MNEHAGKISITFDFIKSDPKSVAKMFSLLEFIPIKAEAIYYDSSIEYIGYSPKFRKIEKGEIIPVYRIILEKDEEGLVTRIYVKELI